MTIEPVIFSTLFALSVSVMFIACGSSENNSSEPAALSKPASSMFADSIVKVVKLDKTYHVTEAYADKGILRIAVTNPDPDVVGHFNIMYDLHVVRVIYDSKDSIAMLANGITGIAVYTGKISDAQAYKDLIWENQQH